MAVTYALLATQCPPPQAPVGPYDPAADAASVLTEFSTGTGTGDLAAQNLLVRAEEFGGHFPPGWWLLYDGEPTPDGTVALQLNLPETQARVGALIDKAAASLALADSVSALYNYVWLSSGGTWNKNTSANANAPPSSPPGAGSWNFGGRVTVAAHAITAGTVDLSGVVLPSALGLLRRTADPLAPGDTPPATWRGWTQTKTGVYWWDGTVHRARAAWEITAEVAGVPTNGQVIRRYVVAHPFTLPAGLPGSVGSAGTAATGSSVFHLKKNGGADFGTATFAASGTVPTWAAASDTAFAAGDVLTVVAPATADGTLADVGISLVGVL